MNETEYLISNEANKNHLLKSINQFKNNNNTLEKDKYTMIISWSEDDQRYVVSVPDLPGCMADGKTKIEAVANTDIAIQEWIDTCIKLGRDVPKPQSVDFAKSIPSSIEELFQNYIEIEKQDEVEWDEVQ